MIRRLLYLGLGLGLALLLSCEAPRPRPALRITAGPLPEGATALSAKLVRDGQRIEPPLDFDLAPAQGRKEASFGLFLPEDASGSLVLHARVRDGAGCVVALGSTGAQVANLDLLDIRLPLESQAGCGEDAPRIERASPAYLRTEGGEALTITGSGFFPGASVSLGGSEAEIVRRGTSEIQVISPPMPGAFGKQPLVITNPDGTRVERGDLVSCYVTQPRFDFASFATFGMVNGAQIRFTPVWTALLDMNGDGLLDIVANNGTGPGSPGLGVFLNLGKGIFEGRALLSDVIKTPMGATAVGQMVTADLLRTGKPQLLVSVTEPSPALLILRPDGAGGSELVKSYPVGPAFGTADVNGDGRPDVVAGQQATLVSLLGTGDPADPLAERHRVATTAGVRTIGFADVNRDGKIDLVVGVVSSVVAHLGKGDGTFADAQTLGVDGPNDRRLGVGDLNGDGWPDLATGVVDNSKTGVFLNRKNDETGRWRGFDGGVTYDLPGIQLGSRTLHDMNGDGRLDLVAAASQSSLPILLGRGDGGFPQPGEPGRVFLPTPANSVGRFLSIGDLDNDGRPDLVFPVVSPEGNLIIYRNRSE